MQAMACSPGIAEGPQPLTDPSVDWESDRALLADAYLGNGLPRDAEDHLRRAGACYHDDAEALRHLEAAHRAAPDHPAVLIGHYRFYFYKNRLEEALAIARLCLKKAARDNGFAEDWRAVTGRDAAFSKFEAALPRFFLFALKGYAYLHLRLGRLEEGRAALDKLRELDPGDKLGGTVLSGVLERYGRGDDD